MPRGNEQRFIEADHAFEVFITGDAVHVSLLKSRELSGLDVANPRLMAIRVAFRDLVRGTTIPGAIPSAKLDRILEMTKRAIQNTGRSEFWLGCPHGYLVKLDKDPTQGSNARRDYLVACPTDQSGAASILAMLAQFNTTTIRELVRGYKLAKAAGLLGAEAGDAA